MKFYAHSGSSSDNAFTTINGTPTRTFMAFDSKAERKNYQEKTWNNSCQLENVIPCTRKFVEQWKGRDFVTVKGGDNQQYCYSEAEYEQHMC